VVNIAHPAFYKSEIEICAHYLIPLLSMIRDSVFPVLLRAGQLTCLPSHCGNALFTRTKRSKGQ
jgi:hypothetical protein